MRSIRGLNGETTIKMSKQEWTNIGSKAGWLEELKEELKEELTPLSIINLVLDELENYEEIL